MMRDIDRMHHFFASGRTLPLSFRRRQLLQLRSAVQTHETLLMKALARDLGKAAFEAYETEIGIVYRELDHTLRHLEKWARPRSVPTPPMHFPARSMVLPRPMGVALIMAPWNYPVQLTLVPLIAAIAAGNCAAVKPSRYCAHTADVLAFLLTSIYPPYYVKVFRGGSEMNKALLAEQFDTIFFTGSTHVGREVLRAASAHLTPVTLELGGKSPCIVGACTDLEVAARRIIWGKLLNAGQTCVAPDYVLVKREAFHPLITQMRRAIRSFYGDCPLQNPEYPKIINQKHYDRLTRLLKASEILSGGGTDSTLLKIEPTLVRAYSLEDAVMQEEIFGPILPVIPVDSFADAEEIIRALPKPLALYLFTDHHALRRRVLCTIPSGGVCVGDTVVHLANSSLPFGGVGESGMGSYHGKKGFDAFSHEKSVMYRGAWPDIAFRYPPYGGKLSGLKKLMKL